MGPIRKEEMDGQKLINQMKRLSEVKETKDLQQLTAALFPGSHCPLMGAMMVIGGIEDALMLVLGTDECTYYTKKATVGGFNFENSLDNRCFSIHIGRHEVTFGCKELLYDAFAELMEERQPKAVFLVTTCVLEVTGDDVDSMAQELSAMYQTPVIPVHTEHFKSVNHLPGVRDTITACFGLIREPQQIQKKRVNILGQRLGKIDKTELYRELCKHDVEIGMKLPGGTDVESIQNAATAEVNIVVNPLGLPLAQKMKEKFGTPYVLFDKYVTPSLILKSYRELYSYLGISAEEELTAQYEEAERAVSAAHTEVAGMKYIYGNTSLACYEYNAFLVSLGMEPQIIQANEIGEDDMVFREEILQKYNPYMTRTANIAPLQYVYEILQPDLYLGHEYAMRLRAKKIVLISDSGINNMHGFEVTGTVLAELRSAAEESRKLKKGIVA